MTTETKAAIKDVFDALMANHWNWGFAEFCQRCRINPGHPHSQKQWLAFQALYEALYAIDADILDVVGTKETGRIVGGTYDGMTPVEMLADRDAFNRAVGG
jgi:hypothetical protein